MAVLGAAAARGWQLADIRAAVASGAWKGLAALYARSSEPGRMERLLPLEWRKTIDRISREKNVRRCAIAVRLVLLALGQAAMVSGSSTIEFGTRNIALHSALSHRTVARVLRMLGCR
jgi:hypothetical protein